ncbi:hypothetical protein CO174_02100 [Candidatus Uhrbacteria bacterium CG_4_9_14_3_um_filter_50_9]|uniref:Uncharacterized protein n=1 Tax=Candidatus Uhrbacteria bacterium CG_4_9_14_3_um_filter_50_9 TaxID=1975035 RepID=A0A2M7XCQ0_9BACT|nr:MAG: hypothetical protein CO174_02100 [Candidatus Uhrbacteria bacterium CG_4_9_14_3_um_filter_50_9]
MLDRLNAWLKSTIPKIKDLGENLWDLVWVLWWPCLISIWIFCVISVVIYWIIVIAFWILCSVAMLA